MGSNNIKWNDLLDERQGGKRDFFIECRFVFYSASLIAFPAFLIWLEFDYNLLGMMFKILKTGYLW